ncbi:MAG: hypothetical protein GF409_07985 [Candidatus Omnitrophica bacterium]|nr:hypothetical protein [Candidatus Omnitrophota bacterium]
MANKDLHVSYRITQEMLEYHEDLMEKICSRVGTRVPQSRVMRAIMAVTRDDPKFKEQLIGKVSDYLQKDLNNW